MERIKKYFYLHIIILLYSFTGLYSKKAAIYYNLFGMQNYKFILFIFLMFLNCFIYAITWQRIIRYFDLNIAYANKSIYIVWSQVWAVLAFGEQLTLANIIGITLVISGVVLVINNE